jgi:hypothetical protein
MGNPQEAANRPAWARKSSELYNEPAATPSIRDLGATAGLKQALEKRWSICAFN